MTMTTNVHSGKTNVSMQKWTWIEDVFPIENGDIAASYVGLLEGRCNFFPYHAMKSSFKFWLEELTFFIDLNGRH